MKHRKLVFINGILVILIFLFIRLNAQETGMPHGDDFSRSCDQCHSTDTWQVIPEQVTFDHNETGFPLEGTHQNVTCRECHQSLVFNRIGSACADCHTDIHEAELGFRCEDCHTPDGWILTENQRVRHMETDFPLTGIHAIVDCESCHLDPLEREFVNTPVECQGCHLEDYNETTNPSHIAVGFGTTCRDCHSQNSVMWGQAGFIHPASFPLKGGHARAACQDCHESQWAGLPTDCYACHQQEYENATEPDHQLFGFPTTCTTCHTINLWEEATFDHLQASDFPLEGVHNEILCTDCHINNQMTGIPTDCFGCHETEYNNSTEPSHQAAGFPTTCSDCHNSSAWVPADWDHDSQYFPIYSGSHRNEWNTCEDCHVNSGNYQQFECIECHEHSRANTDGRHNEVRNYEYASSACYSCHPRGRGEDD